MPDRIEETTTSPAPRPRNRAWDTLSLIFEYEPQGSEQALWGQICKLANETAERNGSDPAEEIAQRAKRMVGQWGVKTLTPPSLKKHWDRFGSTLGTVTEKDEDRMKDDWDREARRRRMEELENAPDQLTAGGRR